MQWKIITANTHTHIYAIVVPFICLLSHISIYLYTHCTLQWLFLQYTICNMDLAKIWSAKLNIKCSFCSNRIKLLEFENMMPPFLLTELLNEKKKKSNTVTHWRWQKLKKKKEREFSTTTAGSHQIESRTLTTVAREQLSKDALILSFLFSLGLVRIPRLSRMNRREIKKKLFFFNFKP